MFATAVGLAAVGGRTRFFDGKEFKGDELGELERFGLKHLSSDMATGY